MEVTCGTTVDPDAGAGVEVTGGGTEGAVAAAGLGGDVG